MRQSSSNVKCVLSLKSIFVILLSTTVKVITPHQAPQDGYYKREHSLVKPYSHGGGSMPFFESQGDTMVTNSFIRVTPDDKSRRGGLWNKVPVYSRAWETVVTFKVHGSSRNLAADGMAFWYVQQKKDEGGVFGGPAKFKGLGIFLDTYKNGQSSGAFPRVSGFVNDGTWEFDHGSDGDKQSFGHCYAMARNREHDTDLKIRYKDRKITVSVDVDGNGSWRLCFERQGLVLPTGYFFGVTAATGDLSDNHDIIAIRTYQIETTDNSATMETNNEVPRLESMGAEDSESSRNSADEEDSGGKFWVLLFLALSICGGVGYVVFQKKEAANRKRFY